MRILRADAVDSMNVKMRKVRTAVRRALNMKKTTNPTTMEDLEESETSKGGVDTNVGTTENENATDV